MIKAIIFDCFGVLTIESWLPFKRRHFSHDRELKQSATDLMKQSTTGLISYDDFVEGVAGLSKLGVGDVRQQLGRNIPNEELFDYISHQLKPHHTVSMLSNMARNRLDNLFTPEQQAVFDDILLSCEVGLVKPDPRIFRLACERLNVEPEEAVLVDDIAAYCDAAMQENMKSVVYTDFYQFKIEIEPLLSHT